MSEKLEMMISKDEYETRVAVLEDSNLIEIYVEREGEPQVVGNIYLGHVKNILPGMEAAFVDIGLEKNAFLYVEEAVFPAEELDTELKIHHLLKQGQDLLVQVIKEPMGTKGARVSSQVALPGRYLVLLPFANFVGMSRKLEFEERTRLRELCEAIKPKNMGLIARTAAEGKNLDDLRKDLKYLRRLWKNISYKASKATSPALIHQEMELGLRSVRDTFSSKFEKLAVDSSKLYGKIVAYLSKVAPELKGRVVFYKERMPLFEKYDLEKKIAETFKRKVWLRSGGYITVDKTEALTAIDVNTGKYIGRKSLEETVLKTNLEAAQEIVHQLRLRGIGGIIVIDFIDMENPSNRDQVFRVLSEGLAKDRTKSEVVEISRLGLVEMTRKNVSKGIWEFVGETCSACHGRGRILSDDTKIIEVKRGIKGTCLTHGSDAFVFEVSSKIASSLLENGGRELRIIRRRTGRRIYVLEDSKIGEFDYKLAKEGARREVEDYLRDLEKEKKLGKEKG